MSELKPCPFCGRAELRFTGECHANYRSHVVECHCSARVYGRDSSSVIKAWNTRAIPEGMVEKDAKIDRLLKALNRRAAVEQQLFDIANGKADIPDGEQCRKLALELGVPDTFKGERP